MRRWEHKCAWEFTRWEGVTHDPHLPFTLCWGPTPGQALCLLAGDTLWIWGGRGGCSCHPVPWAPARSASFPRIVTHPTKNVIRECIPHTPGIPGSRLDFLSSEHRGTRRKSFVSCSLLVFGFLWILTNLTLSAECNYCLKTWRIVEMAKFHIVFIREMSTYKVTDSLPNNMDSKKTP